MGAHWNKGNYIKEIIISVIIITIVPQSTYGLISPETYLSNISSSEAKHTFKNDVSLTDNEIKTILYQFNKIDDDFKTIQRIFSLQSKESKTRTIRSMQNRLNCTISKDKLTNLKNEIKNILSQSTSESKSIKCTLDETDSNNCNELIKVIQCGIKHFKNSLNLNKGSINEIVIWQNMYNDLLDKFEKNSNNIEQALSQEHKKELDKLRNDLQDLGKLLNTALESLQTALIELCVSKIKLGNIEEAVKYSKDLKSISISKIINKSYNDGYKELKHFQKIIQFITLQPKEQNLNGLETLYNEMKLINDLYSLNVILLASGIQRSPAKNDLKNLNVKIENYSNKIKDLWTNMILNNGGDEQLKNFAKNFPNQFHDHLNDTMQKTLRITDAITEKFDNIIKFIEGLTDLEQQSLACLVLFKEMNRQNMLKTNSEAGLIFIPKKYTKRHISLLVWTRGVPGQIEICQRCQLLRVHISSLRFNLA
ncbi:uncharacterized protein LOC123290982 [Chrysoperla carnea]|uniref:uncharacterized protein LOC123290982 n=1 Tax=Chrysoperla carnea TaxID=189513 RepID=UPI001D085D95|nr:uncharacterized protein LOC123290982 [Chrysoperla carnea]